jgi:hypothetical protein
MISQVPGYTSTHLVMILATRQHGWTIFVSSIGLDITVQTHGSMG